MKLQGTIRKTVMAAIHIAIAKCSMYDGFDFYGDGMLGNDCYGGEPMQTLDDAYYYGDQQFAPEGSCYTGGCSVGGPSIGGYSTGGCPIGAPAIDYAVGGPSVAYSAEPSIAYSAGYSAEPSVAYSAGYSAGPSAGYSAGGAVGGCSLQGDIPAIGGSPYQGNYYIAESQASNGYATPYTMSSGYVQEPSVPTYQAMESAPTSTYSSAPTSTSSSVSSQCPVHSAGASASGSSSSSAGVSSSAGASSSSSGSASANTGMTEPITVLLNGTVPVELHPSTITVGGDTFPLSGSAAAISATAQNPLLVGQTTMENIDLSEAVIISLPTPTQSEIQAERLLKEEGITAAQLKKDQEASCKDKKSSAGGAKKKGKKCKKSKKCKVGKVPPKKNGVAGVSALVAIAVLPVIALLM